jgi:nucleotide-binding universal stress UspA family protein
LLASLGVELMVLHVAPNADATDNAAVLDSVLRTGLATDLPAIVRTRTVSGARPAEGILEAAQPTDFDMTVVVAQSRSFLGNLFHRSVTAQVLMHSKLPVLVLPAQLRSHRFVCSK